MAAPKSDIISTAIETQKDQDAANSKQKLLVPRRIMEEEVWLSGSELKTDNSSSDEERGDSSVDSKDRAKKGAKKKTKTISQSARNRTKILREYHQQETITETFRSVKEVTSSTTTSSSTDLNDLSLNDQNTPSMNTLDKMLSRCEDASRHFIKMSCNKADDEKSQLQKIKQLEERIARAEKIYMNAREETDRLVAQMAKLLNNVSEIQGPDWEFFTDVTKKWIRCFSSPSSKTNIFDGCIDSNQNLNQSIEKNQLRKSRHLAIRNKEKKKKLIKIQKGTNYNIVLRNIKQCSKAKLARETKFQKMTEQDSNRLRSLIRTTNDIYNSNIDYMGYKLRPEELQRISTISNQLHLAQQNPRGSITDDHSSPVLTRTNINPDYTQYGSLTDSEKQILFASRSNTSLADSLDEYGSCEETNSDFPSSTNLATPRSG
ncbi:uncharacterized protein LOC119655691 isoform X2 [Hermetia illucens]|uniref:uncharacterized protein LOC119655691 isoform X2 n=1 Tax=Hermetia illucens TaxID=343691 RepID=UPI0018CC681A|nr:uncharacterized protein LOC119655691 isoform X2 [Hermetia illucens]